jgi:hypothetical protein
VPQNALTWTLRRGVTLGGKATRLVYLDTGPSMVNNVAQGCRRGERLRVATAQRRIVIMNRDMSVSVLDGTALNADQPWERFDSVWYLSYNYEILREDDREIIQWIADFFADAPGTRSGHGVDVGTGTNLYPALAMLPRCSQITLIERAATNLRWLTSEVADFALSWDPFWHAMVEWRPDLYKGIKPRAALEARADVAEGDIFRLDRNRYDSGTMFFVAESITGSVSEFKRATTNFVGSLHRRAPFAAAFMKNSRGYRVGSVRFPAVAIDENDVKECLRPVSHGVEIRQTSRGVNPLRDGYDGMILATGYAGKK